MEDRADTRKFFPSVYYVKKKDRGSNRRFDTLIHKTRDGIAISELSPLLYDAGYVYGGTILNVPAEVIDTLDKSLMLRPTSLDVDKQDVVLMATRPVLGEHEGLEEKPLEPSGSELETSIFLELRKIFDTVHRSEVVLSPNVVLPVPYEHLRKIRFHVRQGARIKHYDTENGEILPNDPDSTVGYVAAVPSVSSTGPRLVSAFGMGGTETLWLSHLLRTTLTDLWRRAIAATEHSIWIVRFRVLRETPFPLLNCDPRNLAIEVINGTVAGEEQG